MTHPIEALLIHYQDDALISWKSSGDSACLEYHIDLGWMVTLYPALGHTKRTTYPDFDAACAALAKLAGVTVAGTNSIAPGPNPAIGD